LFVIKSRFGKYISPAALGFSEDEMIFLDGAQGKFKLLGFGGEDATNPTVF
jgi:hypothetical protein